MLIEQLHRTFPPAMKSYIPQAVEPDFLKRVSFHCRSKDT